MKPLRAGEPLLKAQQFRRCITPMYVSMLFTFPKERYKEKRRSKATRISRTWRCMDESHEVHYSSVHHGSLAGRSSQIASRLGSREWHICKNRCWLLRTNSKCPSWPKVCNLEELHSKTANKAFYTMVDCGVESSVTKEMWTIFWKHQEFIDCKMMQCASALQFLQLWKCCKQCLTMKFNIIRSSHMEEATRGYGMVINWKLTERKEAVWRACWTGPEADISKTRFGLLVQLVPRSNVVWENGAEVTDFLQSDMRTGTVHGMDKEILLSVGWSATGMMLTMAIKKHLSSGWGLHVTEIWSLNCGVF